MHHSVPYGARRTPASRPLGLFITLLCVVVVLTALGSSGCEAPHHKKHHGEALGTFPATTPLKQSTDLNTEYVAQIRAIRHIEIRALEQGYVQEVFVDEGQRIERKQRMFQILPLIFQAEVNKAKAEVDIAAIELKNTQLLAEQNIVSPNALALSKAEVNKAKADLGLAEAHKSLTEIRASFGGIMGRLEVREGSLVEEGELLTTLSDNSTVWVYFNVSEREYLDYQLAAQEDDEPLTVRLEMANGTLFENPGKVETIEADFNNETGNIAFRAAFPNPKGLLRHGETGKIIMTKTYPDALVIPQKATFQILDRRFVFVIDDEGVVTSKPIQVAAELPQIFIVESGIEPTDRILLEGLRKVHDGSRIEVDLQAPEKVLASLEAHAE